MASKRTPLPEATAISNLCAVWHIDTLPTTASLVDSFMAGVDDVYRQQVAFAVRQNVTLYREGQTSLLPTAKSIINAVQSVVDFANG